MKFLMSLLLLSSFAIAKDKKDTEEGEELQERVTLETIIIAPVDRQPASTAGGRDLR